MDVTVLDIVASLELTSGRKEDATREPNPRIWRHDQRRKVRPVDVILHDHGVCDIIRIRNDLAPYHRDGLTLNNERTATRPEHWGTPEIDCLGVVGGDIQA